jgi:hypothetical protein
MPNQLHKIQHAASTKLVSAMSPHEVSRALEPRNWGASGMHVAGKVLPGMKTAYK